MQGNLKRKTLTGLRWNSLSTIGLALGQLLLLLWSAGQMPKSELGLMALTQTFIGFASFFVDAGLTNAVLYDAGLPPTQLRFFQRLSLVLGAAMGGLLFASGAGLGLFFGDARLQQLSGLAGVGVCGMSAGVLHRTLLRRDLRFGLIAAVEMGAFLAGAAVSVLLVRDGQGALGLMWGQLVNFGGAAVAFLWFGRHSFEWSGPAARPKDSAWWRFALFQMGERLVNFFNQRLDNLLVAKFLGLEILGGYDLLKQLLGRPKALLSSISGQVILPVLLAEKPEQPKLRAAYLDVMEFNSGFNFPLLVGVAFLAESFAAVLPGGQWAAWAPVIPLLSLFFLIQSTGSSASLPALSAGRADVGFYWNLALSLLVPIFVWAGLPWALFGVVLSLTLLQALLIVPNYFFQVKPFIGGRFWSYCAVLLRPLALSLLAAAVASLVQHWAGVSRNGFVAALLSLLLGYAWLTFRFNPRFWRFCKHLAGLTSQSPTTNHR